LLDEGFHRVVGCRSGELLQGNAGLEAERHGGSGSGLEDVPALGLAAGLADGLCLRIVGMDLDGELVVGK
jgi:hypothetical protein